MSSLGFARFAALFIIAVLGLAGQVAVAPVGLPDLPADTLAHGWERFYSPVREVGFLALFLAAIVIALQQYKDGVTPGTLLLTPFAVVFYLMLPDFLPSGLGPGIVVLLMLGSLFAIVAAVLVDMQPEEPGRPAFHTALGYILALVMYLGSLTTAAGIPASLLGNNVPAIRWGIELLSVLIVPAFLVFTPLFKAVWNRPASGFWFR